MASARHRLGMGGESGVCGFIVIALVFGRVAGGQGGEEEDGEEGEFHFVGVLRRMGGVGSITDWLPPPPR